MHLFFKMFVASLAMSVSAHAQELSDIDSYQQWKIAKPRDAILLCEELRLVQNLPPKVVETCTRINDEVLAHRLERLDKTLEESATTNSVLLARAAVLSNKSLIDKIRAEWRKVKIDKSYRHKKVPFAASRLTCQSALVWGEFLCRLPTVEKQIVLGACDAERCDMATEVEYVWAHVKQDGSVISRIAYLEYLTNEDQYLAGDESALDGNAPSPNGVVGILKRLGSKKQ